MFRQALLITLFIMCAPSISSADQRPTDDLVASLCSLAAHSSDANLRKQTEEKCAPFTHASNATSANRVKIGVGVKSAPSTDPALVLSATVPSRIVKRLPQRLFVRMDPLDNFFYTYGTSQQAAGASISYTENQLAPGSNGAFTTTQTATVTGIVSYTLLKEPYDSKSTGFSWMPAVWVSANGNWDNPLKPTTDLNALKTGFDFQFHHEPGGSVLRFLNDDYYSIAPYYQTDFRGVAHAEGVRLAWEPVLSAAYLGQSNGPLNNFINGFWEVRPETTFLEVSNPGLTNLTRGSYTWSGGIARVYLYPFPTYSPNFWSPDLAKYLADRFTFIATAEYFWDAYSHTDVRYYSAQLQYALLGCPKKDAPCDQPTASISFEYDHGADPDTLLVSSKYLGKLNYKQ
jgi:hypothetical protein